MWLNTRQFRDWRNFHRGVWAENTASLYRYFCFDAENLWSNIESQWTIVVWMARMLGLFFVNNTDCPIALWSELWISYLFAVFTIYKMFAFIRRSLHTWLLSAQEIAVPLNIRMLEKSRLVQCGEFGPYWSSRTVSLNAVGSSKWLSCSLVGDVYSLHLARMLSDVVEVSNHCGCPCWVIKATIQLYASLSLSLRHSFLNGKAHALVTQSIYCN